MVPFAITLSDLIERGGAYAGLAAFFGLAVLAVLHFAAMRELKRLREWAGRAPERAQELEERVMAQAEEARRLRVQPAAATKPATAAGAGQPQPAATPAASAAPTSATPAPATPAPATPATTAATAAPAAAATTTAKPATAAVPAMAGAAASATSGGGQAPPAEAPGRAETDDADDEAGVTEVERPEQSTEVVPAAGNGASPPAGPEAERAAEDEPPAEPSATEQPVVARATPAQEPKTSVADSVPAANGVQSAAEVQRPATPPPSRPAPPRPGQPRRPAGAAALSASTAASRRPPLGRAGAPPAAALPRRRRPLLVVGVLVVLAAVAVAAVILVGGGSDDGTPATQSTAQSPSTTAAPGGGGGGKGQAGNGPETASRADTNVVVLNGTTVTGLAASVTEKLQTAGFQTGTPNTYTDQARSASVVFYADNAHRKPALEVAKLLDVSDVQAMIDSARALAPGADVVVVVGSDQSP